MRKIIKEWGNSLVIVFNGEDQKINPELKKGNIIDLSDCFIEAPKIEGEDK